MLGAATLYQPCIGLIFFLSCSQSARIIVGVKAGGLLFITRASAYAGSIVFTAKMIIVSVGLLNGLLLRIAASHRHPPQWVIEGRVPAAVRVGAVLSLTAWITALVLGRLVGYTH